MLEDEDDDETQRIPVRGGIAQRLSSGSISNSGEVEWKQREDGLVDQDVPFRRWLGVVGAGRIVAWSSRLLSVLWGVRG